MKIFSLIKTALTVGLCLVSTLGFSQRLEVLHPPLPDESYFLNQTLSGVNFTVEWAAVDQGPNISPRYNWTATDAELQPWFKSGKKVNLIVWPLAATNINTSTPAYVLESLGKSDTTTCNGEVTPNYFNYTFQTDYKNFIQQVLEHYGGNSAVGYIRIGLARGGETYPNLGFDSDPVCSKAFTTWGWTPATWTTYVTSMLEYETSLHPQKQLMVGINTVNGYTSIPDAVAATAVSLGIGFGSQGFQQSDLTLYAAGRPCTADWCALFNRYAGKVPLELQTATQSNPNGEGITGSLVTLLPFATKLHATVIELYNQDWLLAFDPSYQGYSQYGQGYQKALKALYP